MKMFLKKNKRVRFIAVLMLSLIIFSGMLVSADSDIPYNSYIYWTDADKASKRLVSSKDMFSVDRVLDATVFGVTKIKIKDVYCRDGYTYVLDSENSKFFILDEQYNLIKTLTSVRDEQGKEYDFKNCESIFVAADGRIFIPAGKNKSVWVINSDGLITFNYLLPDSEIIPSDFKYNPIKVVCDSTGYVYILSEGSYYGAILYDPNCDFCGFYGANTVGTSVSAALTDFFSELFMNDEKADVSLKKLPYQFNDLDLGDDDFIYTITGRTATTKTGQIRRINPGGKNVYKTDGFYFDDVDVGAFYKGVWINTSISQLSVQGNYIYALDNKLGKIFVYDRECNLLTVLGTGTMLGEVAGSFKSPEYIAVNGKDIIVADTSRENFTIFKRNDYGDLVFKARDLNFESKYDEALPLWKEIVEMDRSSQIGYISIAKTEYFKGNYEEAMKYAELGWDKDTYASAYQYSRNQNITKYSTITVAVVLVVVILAVVLLRIKKKKGIVLIKSEKLKHALSVSMHPFDAYRQVNEKKIGSPLIAVLFLAIFFVTSVMKTTLSGFLYSNYQISGSFNALFELVKTAGLAILWIIANWAVCTLFGGCARIKQLLIVTGYSMVPAILGNIIYTVLSNMLIPNEFVFVQVVCNVLLVYTLLLIGIGTMIVQDFEFKKFFWTTVLTLIGMVIVLFLGFLFIMMFKQLVNFIMTIYFEIAYR